VGRRHRGRSRALADDIPPKRAARASPLGGARPRGGPSGAHPAFSLRQRPSFAISAPR
jgi:hypothetical protein